MKVSAILTAITLGLAGAGLAQAAQTTPTALASAPVVSETQGPEIGSHQTNYPAINTPSTQTRAEVVQALRDYQARGGLVGVHDYSYPHLQANGPAATRAQVVSELHQAESQGLALGSHEPNYPSLNRS